MAQVVVEVTGKDGMLDGALEGSGSLHNRRTGWG